MGTALERYCRSSRPQTVYALRSPTEKPGCHVLPLASLRDPLPDQRQAELHRSLTSPKFLADLTLRQTGVTDQLQQSVFVILGPCRHGTLQKAFVLKCPEDCRFRPARLSGISPPALICRTGFPHPACEARHSVRTISEKNRQFWIPHGIDRVSGAGIGSRPSSSIRQLAPVLHRSGVLPFGSGQHNAARLKYMRTALA